MRKLILVVFATLFSLVDAIPATGRVSNCDDVRPNIVVINLDDADAGLLSPRMLQTYYPNMNVLATGGLRFTNLHATTPFCAASRAALMTGKYSFSNGVKINNPEEAISKGFLGGYGEFLRRGNQDHELGVWLKAAGYRTMHVGKYHHSGYDFKVPPGWDDFYTSNGAKYFETFRFTNENHPKGLGFVTGPNDYITDVEAVDADRLIRKHATERGDQPFFLYLAPMAPHYPQGGNASKMVNHLKYANFAPTEVLLREPDWNEADVSDKPDHLQLAALNTPQIASLELEHISRVRAIKSVDDMIGVVLTALEETDQLDNCYIFLTSDNGYQLGHHRMKNKLDPFDRTTRVPLIVQGPGVPGNVSASHLLAHIDLCPTVLELAGAAIPADVEAKSFVPLLNNPTEFDETTWQTSIMIENWADKFSFGKRIELTYAGLRFFDSVYVSWSNGAREFYDLATDPFQLANLYPSMPEGFQDQLANDLASFRQKPVEPTTTLMSSDELEVFSRSIKVEGIAEDNASLSHIGVTVRSFFTGDYFNGTSWQSGWTQTFAAPVDRNAPVANWRFNQEIELPEGLVHDYLLITARAFDDEGNYPNQVSWDVMPVDKSDPTAEFDDNLEGKIFASSSVSLRGTIDENYRMGSVRVVIRSRSVEFWNGSSLEPGWTYVEAQLGPNNTWTTTANLPSGSYVAAVRAVDLAGNAQKTSSLIRFVVGQ